MEENSNFVRKAVIDGLNHLGFYIDEQKNENPQEGIYNIAHVKSDYAILIVPTNEEKEIALQSVNLINKD